jgi:hypothetical protein
MMQHAEYIKLKIDEDQSKIQNADLRPDSGWKLVRKKNQRRSVKCCQIL